jgi:cell division protein FtsB
MPKNSRRTASSRAGSNTSERPSATRPAAAARGRRPPEDLHTPRSVKRLAILSSIFVMLAITLIPVLRSTVNQQGQIRGLRDRISQQRQAVAALQQEQRSWNDPAYVEQQARQRLKFVRVGERSFTLIDGLSALTDLPGGAQIAAPVHASAADIPWYGELWQSIVVADSATGAATGQPSADLPTR